MQLSVRVRFRAATRPEQRSFRLQLERDEVVKFSMSEDPSTHLQSNGVTGEWREPEFGHGLSRQRSRVGIRLGPPCPLQMV